MDPNAAKFIVKILVGIAGSALLGTIYKGEKAIQGKIDNHYEQKTNETPEQ